MILNGAYLSSIRFRSLLLHTRYLQLLFLIMVNTSAISAPMEFKVHEGASLCAECTLLIADGEITNDSHVLLEKVLLEHRDAFEKDTTIVFNSPGGNLLAGLAIGEVIRTNGFNTHIARVEVNSESDLILTEGICASACAYAYLGGHRRSIEQQSKYGLHQMSTQSDQAVPLNEAVRTTQDIIAEVSFFIERMGASAEIVTIATRTSNDSIHWVDDGSLSTLRIVNSRGITQQTPWKRVTGSTSWTIFSLLPDGSRDLLIMSCNEIPSRINTAGHIRFGLTHLRSLAADHAEYSDFMAIPTQVYLNEAMFFENDEQMYWFYPDSHRTYPIELPVDVLREAARQSAPLTIKIKYPDSFPEEFSSFDHSIPIDGLETALESLTRSCQHLKI